MGNVYLVDGEKGGVGKSVFCKFLHHYLTQKEHKFDFVDADPNPDVHKVYGGITDIRFIVSDEESMLHSEKAGAPDKLIDLACYQDVLVNLPGKVHESVKFWIDANGLLEEEFINEFKVHFHKFFLTNGSVDSIALFEDSLLSYEGKIPHYLVKNLGLISDWQAVEDLEVYQRVRSDHEFKIIELPGIRRTDLNFIDKSGKTFSAVVADLPTLGKQRLKTFLYNASQSIETLGIL